MRKIIEAHRRAAVWVVFTALVIMIISWIFIPWSFAICFFGGGVVCLLLFLFQLSKAIVRRIVEK